MSRTLVAWTMAVLLLTLSGTGCNRTPDSAKIKVDSSAPNLKPITPGPAPKAH